MADTPNEEAPAVTVLSWRQVAESMYRAFVHNMDEFVYAEPVFVEFDKLPPLVQIAYEAAARQVGICLEYGTKGLEAEASWTGWLPPVNPFAPQEEG